MSGPLVAAVGDIIEHELMPGFRMQVQAVADCDTDWNRSEPHLKYTITDPAGNQDDLCAYDVRKATP